MLKITLSPEVSQRFSVTLEGVSCTIKLHQRTTGLYMDMWVNDVLAFAGVLCLNITKIVRYDYVRAASGFKGELFFVDTKGTNDPNYSELGSRYVLYYLASDEIA